MAERFDLDSLDEADPFEIDAQAAHQYIARKKPELILPKRAPVLTSDEPVCWWSPGDGPVGYATAQVVRVPLSPRLMIQFREPTFAVAAHGLPDTRSRAWTLHGAPSSREETAKRAVGGR